MGAYKIRKNPEQHLQEWYCLFLESLGVLYCASAGGMRTNIRTAVKMKRAGYKKGFPDIFIYEPRGKYHGLAVELKLNSRPSNEQMTWNFKLDNKGYYAHIMPHNLTFQQAQNYLEKITKHYLNLK